MVFFKKNKTKTLSDADGIVPATSLFKLGIIQKATLYSREKTFKELYHLFRTEQD